MRLGVLCSGGKDSLFACMMAMEREEVVCLIALRSRNEESYMFHTPNVSLVPLQAEAAELPLVEMPTEGMEEEELEDLIDHMQHLFAGHPSFANSFLQHRQRAGVYAIERILQPMRVNADNQPGHQHIEEDAQFNDKRHAVRGRRGSQEHSVLHD